MINDNPKFTINSFTVTTDTILFYYEQPILCLCKSARDIYYLAYCYDIDNFAWVLAQVSRQTLIDMFNNKVAMDKVFQDSPEKWIGADGELFKRVSPLFDASELPKMDATYGRIGDLEIGLMNRLEAEMKAIKLADFSNKVHTFLREAPNECYGIDQCYDEFVRHKSCDIEEFIKDYHAKGKTPEETAGDIIEGMYYHWHLYQV